MTRYALRTSAEEATVAAGRALAPLLQSGDVILLSGDLGAGKTCLARGIAEGLGVGHPVTSPTFNILLVHPGRVFMNHFDLYRLDSPLQLEDIDYWGTLEAGGVSVVEWGDRFAESIPEDRLIVAMTITGDEERLFDLDACGGRSERLASAWIEACSSIAGATLEGGGQP
ncbi:MAG: tRNA (adenosine(37)-N6)-threonylcarbamoyltransferase complex ATPase subunit type 1 TsaE [Coriobacteriia bacterium]|nr:tRNA (adenosine(37)-N6)-threonylcarbamoyltransferase complex ATPase subunit type 1 TsaE [Coriobacteriia bacterium]